LENYGIRKLEAVFAILIATMALAFAWMFGQTKPSGTELLVGETLNIPFFCLVCGDGSTKMVTVHVF